MSNKLDRFTLNLHEGMSQREAYIKAGYSGRQSDESIDVNACRLANSAKVLLRLEELRKMAEHASVMSVVERKEILTKQARGELTDVEVFTNPQGEQSSRVRKFNPTQAIAELNRMERIGVHESETSINILVSRVVQNLQLNNWDLSKLTDEELDLLESQLNDND